MSRELSIGDAARRLGIEVDTLRRLERDGRIQSRRTEGGHRRFTELALAQYERDQERRRRHTTAPKARPALLRPARQPAGHSLPAPVEIDLPSEFLEDRSEHESPEKFVPPVAMRPPMKTSTSREPDDRARLNRIKHLAILSIPFDIPASWRARVVADLEDFVTARQFPSRLSSFEASSIAQARVEDVLAPYRERQEAEKVRRAAEQRAEWRLATLRSHGNGYAVRETTGWDWSAQSEARREASRELDAKVKSDWSERDVERLVDEVLDDWEDEDDEESEFDDEY